MAQSESDLAKRVVKWLNDQPGILARKRHGTPYGVTGDADVYACVYGRHVEIELKVGKNTPTKLQNKRLEEWNNVGAIVGVAYNLNDVKNIINELLESINV